MERIVSYKLTICVQDSFNPFQFAYRAGRGVEDATITLVHHVTSHLDQAGTSARILFMDMSAAFNTIQHHILLEKLLDLQVNPFIILWIREFLRNRTQRVCLRLKHLSTPNILSDSIIVNSGTPQGCILSSLLFSLYINDIQVHDAFLLLIKYADDLALIGRLKDEYSLGCYLNQIEVLTNKLKDRFLEPNVNKTKELLLGNSPLLKTELVNIDGNTVERVNCFKYLGTYVDEKLKFKQHAESTFKKCQQRLFLLRKLRSFNVSSNILILVYTSLIESILAFNIVTWFHFLTIT